MICSLNRGRVAWTDARGGVYTGVPRDLKVRGSLQVQISSNRTTVRKLLFLLAALAVSAAPLAQSPPAQQADGVVRLLADLETALAAPQEDAFHRLEAPDLPADDLEVFREIREGDGPIQAIVRERDRVPEAGGFTVLVDLLV